MEDVSIKVEEINSINKRIHICVPNNIVEKKFDDFYFTVKAKAELPGFRKGHVPIGVLKSYYSKEAFSVVSRSLFVEFYKQALKNNEILPISSPKIETITNNNPGLFDDSDGSYKISVVVEISPKLNTINYSVNVANPNFNIEIFKNDEIKRYQKMYAEHKQIEGKIELGDTVVVSIEAKDENNNIINALSGQNISIEEIGNKKQIPILEDIIVTMSSGECKEINITIPKDYILKEFVDKNINFKISIHNVIRVTLAQFNEDLAKMSGFESLEKMTEAIDVAAKNNYNEILFKFLESQIIMQLIENNKFDVPQTMIKNEIDQMLVRKNIPSTNLTPNDYRKLQSIALFNIQKNIILETIYNNEKLEVTPQELNKMLEQQSELNNITKDQLISTLYNSNQMDAFTSVLRHRKVIEFIIEKNKVN